MNAPALNRRQFTAGLGAHRRRLLARSEARARPGAAAASRQPADQPQARRLDPHQHRRHRDHLHRQGRAGAGHPHRARPDRGRRARPAARAHRDDLRRYRPDAERRPDRRQPVGREQRHGVAHGRRRGACDPASSSPPKGSAWRRISWRSADGVISAPDGRKVGYGELVAELDLNREASAKTRAEAACEPQDRRQVRFPRFDIPAKVTGGAAFVQDMRLPGMLHGRVVRPPRYGSKLDSVDEAPAKAMPGVVAVVRDGSFLGVVARARGAGDQGARGAAPRARNGRSGRNCPIRRASSM